MKAVALLVSLLALLAAAGPASPLEIPPPSVPAPPKLQVPTLTATVASSATSAYVGTTVTVTITVTDSLSAVAAGLSVDGFGPELVPVSATPNVGTCTTAATRISCSFGGLPPDSPGAVTTCVFQVASPGGVTIDADPTFPLNAVAGHRAGTLALTVNPAAADVSVTVPAATLKPRAGGTVTTTATVRNLGPSPAHAPQLAFTLPSGIKLVSATVGSGTCSVATRTCTFADRAGEATAVVRLALHVTSTAAKHVTVFASAPGEFDPATANNRGSLAVAPPQKTKH